MTPVIRSPTPCPAGAAGLAVGAPAADVPLHLVAMNVTLGARSSPSTGASRAARRCAAARGPPRLLREGAAGRGLRHGDARVAPLLFVQVLYGRLFFTSSILMAGSGSRSSRW